MTIKNLDGSKSGSSRSLLLLFVCLVGIIGLLFFKNFHPDVVQFSNDGPLGADHTAFSRPPASFTGMWNDLNSVGYSAGSFIPNITGILFWVLGPVAFSKFYVPLVVLFSGLCAGIFFRSLQLSTPACVLGGLAAMLNGAAFSAACWGVGPQTISEGFFYLALAAIVGRPGRWPWLRFPLAGLAVGLGVTEGADLGAIRSVCLAAFAFFYIAIMGKGGWPKRIATGVGTVAVIALFAAFIAAQSLSSLISSQIKGVAGMAQDTQTREQRWDWATQWSLPKREALSLLVPGLFGYRMDTPKNLPEPVREAYEGGVYWGAIGRDPSWYPYLASDKSGPPPRGTVRFSGGGPYAGVLTVLVAVWAAAQAFRRKDSVFSDTNRGVILFWTGAAVIALLLAFGRFAPFYRLVYQLPYFSTIRNPIKFVTLVDWSLVILFAMGIHGLTTRYLKSAAAHAGGSLGGWWAKAPAFDRKWTFGSVVAIGLSVVAWIIFASSRAGFESYLETVQIDPAGAHLIAGFSIRQVGWFVLLLVLAVGLVTLVLTGAFAGARARWATALLGLLLVVDLARADLPWIVHWNYKNKYELDRGNPVVDFFRNHPYEGRVVILPWWFKELFQDPRARELISAESVLDSLYGIEWSQHHFLYHNIQSLDVVQMPRPPADISAFDGALQFRFTQDSLSRVTRRWELTNTRYLLAAAAWQDALSQALDPSRQRFRIVQRFNITLKPGVVAFSGYPEDLTAVLDPNGTYAIFEFTGALPRTRLFSQWQVPGEDPGMLQELWTNTLTPGDLDFIKTTGTNDFLTLRTLTLPSFDPHQTVLLNHAPAASGPAGTTNGEPGTVKFTSYAPKAIALEAQATAPAVLLLNDRYDPDWKVTVDGKPAELLRCNYIMRGVFLQPGTHRVEFRYEPPFQMLYVTLAAIAIGVVFLTMLTVGSRGKNGAEPAPQKV